MKNLLIIISGFIWMAASAQSNPNTLHFVKGNQFQLVSKSNIVITQELMGQSIDINTDGEITHTYEVKNISDSGAVLVHKINRIKMHLEGMGQDRTIDTNNPEDLSDDFGPSLKNFLEKTFEITIDNTGKVLSVNEPKQKDDDGSADMMSNLLKQVAASMDAPKAGENSFFKILPDKKAEKGDMWIDSSNKDGIKEVNNYKISDITDNEIVVEVSNITHTETTAEIMGMEATTKADGKGTGKILIDKKSGIVRQKTLVNSSSGNVEVMGQSVPLTTKSTTTVEVLSK